MKICFTILLLPLLLSIFFLSCDHDNQILTSSEQIESLKISPDVMRELNILLAYKRRGNDVNAYSKRRLHLEQIEANEKGEIKLFIMYRNNPVEDLMYLGCTIIYHGKWTISAWVPLESIAKILELRDVRYIRAKTTAHKRK